MSAISIETYLNAIKATLNQHADEIEALDQAIGDGDHLINLQRGIDALIAEQMVLDDLDFPAALNKIGMTLMASMGGASGSLFGSMFIAMGKSAQQQSADFAGLVTIFNQGVEAIKSRGKASVGEKTMLDTLMPAAASLEESVNTEKNLRTALTSMQQAAEAGMLSTKDMLATKGRASFLGERSKGHIDAGARTSQLILSAIADVILKSQ